MFSVSALMRSAAKARVSGSRVRSVPTILTSSAMMLLLVPPWMVPMVRTALLSGEILRLTKVWRPETTPAAATMASTPFSG